MRVDPNGIGHGVWRRVRDRLGAESGFTMIVALGVLVVTALLAAAVFTTVSSDAFLTRADLDGKRAYAAAQAGLQEYLYQLNDNAATSSWWETCSNDTASSVAVPGSTSETYSYQPVPANGQTACVSTNPVGSLIDTTTGTLRMAFTGTSGQATRTVVASFKTLSPLSFLWYTVYETEDNSLPGATGCNQFYYNDPSLPTTNPNCVINWVTGDVMNGPMYTQDQFYVPSGNSPQFGRLNSQDAIASQVPTSGSNDICALSQCYGAKISNREPDVSPQVPLPHDNGNLQADATAHGLAVTGTTTLTVSGNTATGATCTSNSSTSCTPINITDLTKTPIIYASNGTGCTSSYTPASVSYTNTVSSGTYRGDYYGTCGDIYVSGTYSSPLTIAAADDVIVTGNLLNSTDTNPTGTGALTGSATLGLVANEYVRVMHTCSGNPNVTIDGAILTLQHSFFVDNYGCGGMPQGLLTVHGAIAQYFRGIVGTVGASGYLKNYNYDQRLALILPPYLFDLQNTEWEVYRETECSTTVSQSASNSCGVS
jgi:Tfp pilus assembly protein PilX